MPIVWATLYEPTHLYLAQPLGVTQSEFRRDFGIRKLRVHGLS